MISDYTDLKICRIKDLLLIPPVNEHERARSRAGLLVGKAHFFTS
jgi:hypothetical protein